VHLPSSIVRWPIVGDGRAELGQLGLRRVELAEEAVPTANAMPTGLAV
jgi:hypothetical protein